jgi:phosphomannomutase
MMEALRARPPAHLDGDPVVAVVDYLPGARGLPRSDVIALELASGSRVIARPSGTEPKVKFYFDVQEAVRGDVPAARSRALASMARLKSAFLAELEREGRPSGP